MPIRKAEKKAHAPPPGVVQRTGEYSQTFCPPQAYKPITTPPPIAPSFLPGTIPSISTRDLGYFFDLAASLYSEHTTQAPPRITSAHSLSSSTDSPPRYDGAPPSYGADFQNTAVDVTAVLVMRLFRLTRTDIFPIAERFHLGPADRQPLYSLTAQPSIRSGTEFNELAIKRRDPIHGVWHSTCTSDIEPSLDLVKPGNWVVAKLIMEAIPVWVQNGIPSSVSSRTLDGRGNSLRLSWGDRQTLGPLGDAYGLWWDNGIEGGLAEAFYVVEGWQGFESRPQGLIRIKPAVKDVNGQYQDPRRTPLDWAVIYFHPDDKILPQFVCANVEAQVRLDIIMAGLMTVMVIETRKISVIREMGSLPAYDSNAHWSSRFVEEGIDLGDAWGS